MPVATTTRELAIHGGKPVRATFLPYARQSVTDGDIRAVVDVLRSDWLTTGPKVCEFEEKFAAYVGARYAVSFSSGTAALHGAVFAAGLSTGDDAITSPLTFAATANAVLYQGATPKFADVCSDTLTIDPDAVCASLTARTRAILPVDYAGHPADLDAILEIARRPELVVIEDAAHSLGASYRGRRVGSIADMTTFSFHPVKHLTTGEGGMVTTNYAQFAERLRRFRNHGLSSGARERQASGEWRYDMVELGFNYRLPDIACALGIEQLKRMDSNLARRREIAERYTTALQAVPSIVLPQTRNDVIPAWHLYPIRLRLAELSAGRDEIFRALRAENIGVNVHYIPIHLHSYYRERFGYRGGEFPVAERAYEALISLPMFYGMNQQDVEDVINAVEKVCSAYACT